jgi:hypothetical protein
MPTRTIDELTFLPAVNMAEQIRKKKISPVELVAAHLAKQWIVFSYYSTLPSCRVT